MPLPKEARGASPHFDAPLADRMRPRTLDEVVGQDGIVGPGKPLRRAIEAGEVPSLLLWGPPGSGKTTLARLLAQLSGYRFVGLSAVLVGVKEVREVVEEARVRRAEGGRTLLFLDEIHRFNKAQQDALLPHVEDGTLTLVGATTENPSFQVNSALLSRLLVQRLEPLGEGELRALVRRALEDGVRGLGARAVTLDRGAEELLVRTAQGDARRALNLLEASAWVAPTGSDAGRTIDLATLSQTLQSPTLYHDATGDWHYDVVSALIKSLRGSDPDAALYWLARMVEAGEDPLFIARRLVIFASEDVGNADPEALRLALAVRDSVHFVGMPEGWIPLAQGVVYLATAPKSNASYAAYQRARRDVARLGNLPVPLHLRNAPTRLAREMGHGEGYLYPHDNADAVVAQSYLPEALAGTQYFHPGRFGFEKVIAERLAWWKRRREERKGGTPG
ncbi:MAG: replication-associated recombination protein A [Deltaproteobacteria bacterium]|nr:replication-associated recombination protein A [Deltaproteobacteria bacterium]